MKFNPADQLLVNWLKKLYEDGVDIKVIKNGDDVDIEYNSNSIGIAKKESPNSDTYLIEKDRILADGSMTVESSKIEHAESRGVECEVLNVLTKSQLLLRFVTRLK